MRTEPHANPSTAGITLIELVVAVVILSIAVTPLLFFFYQGAVAEIRSERQAAAYFLALEKMEEIHADKVNSGYSYLVTGNYPAESPVAGSPAGTGLDSTRTVAFTESPADVMEVTVTVTYSNPSGSYELEQVFCNW